MQDVQGRHVIGGREVQWHGMAYVPPHRRNARPPPAAPSFSLQCSCAQSGKRFSIFNDGHTICATSKPAGGLLGSTSQFCASFFHIEPTPEGGIGEVCLCAECGELSCPRKTVVCVARLQRPVDGEGEAAWADVYSARYFVRRTPHSNASPRLRADGLRSLHCVAELL